MKRIAIWMMLAVCFLMVVAAPVQAAPQTAVDIVIDGEEVILPDSAAAFLESNRTFVPVRGVFAHLGLEIKWDQDSQTATISGDDVTIDIKLGESQVQVNGQATAIDSPVMMKESRLFIPLRFVVEQAGFEVKWNQEEHTVYLETPALGEELTDTAAFLQELIAAGQQLTSYSAEVDIEQAMSMADENIEMDMRMQMDMVTDPLSFYQHMTMEMEELGESVSSEAYFTEDGFYSYDSMFDQWIKYDEDMYESMIGLSETQLDPVAQFELMEAYIEDLKVYEQEDTYEMHFNVSGEGFQELLELILNMSELGLDEELLEDLNLAIHIDEMSIVTTLDKETLFPLSEQMESDLTITVEGEEIAIRQKADSTYSNFNSLSEINIPQEVIDSAITFDEYLEQIEMDYEEAM
ncbi:copper amine oxidase N-terminal domain-containing protein [Halalkalibacter oceani]|uniref:copper amine oxidase N-terminal domain-containing protein n=1 Tax=Halalkalibacter oceani TaxID=1653776 RepID=UPI003396E739